MNGPIPAVCEILFCATIQAAHSAQRVASNGYAGRITDPDVGLLAQYPLHRVSVIPFLPSSHFTHFQLSLIRRNQSMRRKGRVLNELAPFHALLVRVRS
jgi:hypothetical protein